MIDVIGSLLIGLLLSAVSDAPSRVTGTLVGADGAPIATSHAHLGRPHDVPVVTGAVDANGRFNLTTTERGLVVLKLTGVGHRALEVPLWLAGGDAVDLHARLGPQQRRETVDVVKVIGAFNQFSRKSGKAMTKQPDGTYVLELPADEPIRYQLLGTLDSASVYEGQTADAYEWSHQVGRTGHVEDGYRSVVAPRNGQVRIVFDPARVPRSMDAGRVTFAETSSVSAALAEYERQMEARRAPRAAAALAHYKAGKPSEAFTFDVSPALAEIRAALARELPAPVREALTLEWWTLCYEASSSAPRAACGDDDDDVAALLERVPPDSTIWGWMATKDGVLWTLITRTVDDPRVRPYAARLLDAQPSRRLKAELMYYALVQADRKGNLSDFASYYTKLTTEYPDAAETRRAASYSPDRRIRRGQPLPAFSLPAAGDPSVALTNASVSGKLLLIDVWTTWCPGCRVSMPTLHALYEKYRGVGLEILSVSGDDAIDDLREFRARKETPMPWLHSYIGPVRNGPFMELFEVPGYPTYILVDRSGTILLKSHSHEEVESAIAKALSRGNEGPAY